MSTVSRIHGRGFRVQRDPKRWVAWGLKTGGAGELEGKAGKLDSGRAGAIQEDNRTVKKDNWKKTGRQVEPFWRTISRLGR